MPAVAILLATWRGEDYLPTQLASIAAQRGADWHLITREDGPGPPSPTVAAFARSHPGRVRILTSDTRRGPCGTFASLLAAAAAAGADAVAFCDQDDAWHPERLARGLAVLDRDRPHLVHSGLRICDADLRPTGQDLHVAERLDPYRGVALGRLLRQSCCWGNTMLLNRPLARLAAPPPDAAMHDWWAALVAAAVGRITFLPGPLVDYRIHAGNTLGLSSSGGGWRSKLRRLPAAIARRRVHADQARRQALALAAAVPGTAASQEATRFARAMASGPLSWRMAWLRHGWCRHGAWRNLGDLILPP
jgi:glycosyltransferase involved in cell wall biosynthesis